MKYPLTAVMLDKIRGNIHRLTTAFETAEMEIKFIGAEPPIMRLSAESEFWPKDEALSYFAQQGKLELVGNKFKILDEAYFGLAISSFPTPISFSIDEHIQSGLQVMAGLYVLIYDLENRLRFTFDAKLTQKYGSDYKSKLPKSVSSDIDKNLTNKLLYVTDTRSNALDYADFSNMHVIVSSNPEFVGKHSQEVTDKLKYLNNVRILIAHNHPLVPNEVAKIHETCEFIKAAIL